MIPFLLGAKTAGAFALKHWRLAVIAGLVLYIVILKFSLADEKLHGVRLSKRLAETTAAYAQFAADVKAKTAQAQAEDAAHKASVETAQSNVSQESSHDYQAQLADLHRRYAALQLRSVSPKANTSGGGKPAVPEVPNPASGPDAAAAQDRLPAGDALIASEQALQLQGLQGWIKSEQAIPR